MTPEQRWGAFLMTLGLSVRVSQLAAVDRADPGVAVYVGRHRTP
ncbi:hypothetical protein [Nonomuraea wenchangensis]|uniref:Uncharacterized protein n=1 Tax=Nonomuraea wenchangensis TaxID=568860 RepID=A0A1I0F3Y3_9ACTN|nr:hypothetical protein [Nonomuraea wenchangensis]SET52540.1 hypothetical protein SAMN05421811_103311 [Nonomuraea wenchangensis]